MHYFITITTYPSSNCRPLFYEDQVNAVDLFPPRDMDDSILAGDDVSDKKLLELLDLPSEGELNPIEGSINIL